MSVLTFLDGILDECSNATESDCTTVSKVRIRKRVKSEYLTAEENYWKRELTKYGLDSLSGFHIVPPEKLPPFKPHKPSLPLCEQPPGKPTPLAEWKAILCERQDQTLGQVRYIAQAVSQRESSPQYPASQVLA
jgi:hypothetical protein